MDSGSYAACAGLLARTQQLDIAAQDLANLNTTGYRAQQTTFQAVLAKSNSLPSNAWSDRLNDFGVLGASRVVRAAGNLVSTGNPLDLGIEGDGFFVVQTPGGVQFTRNGQFLLSADRTLVTHDGYPVLGEQGPVRVPEGPLSISGDGTLSVGGALAGKLRLAGFPASVPLQASGSGYYSAPQDAGTPALNSALRQGALESSNVNPVIGAVQLIALQRTAQMLQRALSAFHSDFDRIAAEDLPRV